MLALAYPGAASLVNARGETVIECATPKIAAYLLREHNAVGGLVNSVESTTELRIVRSQIEIAEIWRDQPEELKP